MDSEPTCRTLSVKDAAAIVGISIDLAYALISEGRFPSINVSRAGASRRRLRVSIEALDRWLNAGGVQQELTATPARTARPGKRRADWSKLERVQTSRAA